MLISHNHYHPHFIIRSSIPSQFLHVMINCKLLCEVSGISALSSQKFMREEQDRFLNMREQFLK